MICWQGIRYFDPYKFTPRYVIFIIRITQKESYFIQLKDANTRWHFQSDINAHRTMLKP